MSRSRRAPFVVDNGHSGESKRRASRRHRRGEKVRINVLGEDYQPLPSISYTNPYDICDFFWYEDGDKLRRK